MQFRNQRDFLLPLYKCFNLFEQELSLVGSFQSYSEGRRSSCLQPLCVWCIIFRTWGINVKWGVKLLLPDCEMPVLCVSCVTSVVTVTCHAVTERPRHVFTAPLTTGYCLHRGPGPWSQTPGPRPAHTDPEHGAHRAILCTGRWSRIIQIITLKSLLISSI